MINLQSAVVMYGEEVVIGSRVKHFGQRYTGSATVTVTGLHADVDGYSKDWVRVDVEPDDDSSVYGTTWDWDRTELAPDV